MNIQIPSGGSGVMRHAVITVCIGVACALAWWGVGAWQNWSPLFIVTGSLMLVSMGCLVAGAMLGKDYPVRGKVLEWLSGGVFASVGVGILITYVVQPRIEESLSTPETQLRNHDITYAVGDAIGLQFEDAARWTELPGDGPNPSWTDGDRAIASRCAARAADLWPRLMAHAPFRAYYDELTEPSIVAMVEKWSEPTTTDPARLDLLVRVMCSDRDFPVRKNGRPDESDSDWEALDRALASPESAKVALGVLPTHEMSHPASMGALCTAISTNFGTRFKDTIQKEAKHAKASAALNFMTAGAILKQQTAIREGVDATREEVQRLRPTMIGMQAAADQVFRSAKNPDELSLSRVAEGADRINISRRLLELIEYRAALGIDANALAVLRAGTTESIREYTRVAARRLVESPVTPKPEHETDLELLWLLNELQGGPVRDGGTDYDALLDKAIQWAPELGILSWPKQYREVIQVTPGQRKELAEQYVIERIASGRSVTERPLELVEANTDSSETLDRIYAEYAKRGGTQPDVAECWRMMARARLILKSDRDGARRYLAQGVEALRAKHNNAPLSRILPSYVEYTLRMDQASMEPPGCGDELARDAASAAARAGMQSEWAWLQWAMSMNRAYAGAPASEVIELRERAVTAMERLRVIPPAYWNLRSPRLRGDSWQDGIMPNLSEASWMYVQLAHDYEDTGRIDLAIRTWSRLVESAVWTESNDIAAYNLALDQFVRLNHSWLAYDPMQRLHEYKESYGREREQVLTYMNTAYTLGKMGDHAGQRHYLRRIVELTGFDMCIGSQSMGRAAHHGAIAVDELFGGNGPIRNDLTREDFELLEEWLARPDIGCRRYLLRRAVQVFEAYGMTVRAAQIRAEDRALAQASSSAHQNTLIALQEEVLPLLEAGHEMEAREILFRLMREYKGQDATFAFNDSILAFSPVRTPTMSWSQYLALLKEVVTIRPEWSFVVNIAPEFETISDSLMQDGDAVEAAEALDLYLFFAQRTRRGTEFFGRMSAQINAAESQDQWHEAARLRRLMIREQRRVRPDSNFVRDLDGLAANAVRRQDWAEAAACRRESVEIRRTCGPRDLLMESAMNAAIAESVLGNYSSAISLYTEAFRTSIELGENETGRKILKQLGDTQMRAGLYSDALQSFRNAETSRRRDIAKPADPDLAECIGDALFGMKDYAGAHDSWAQARTGYNRRGFDFMSFGIERRMKELEAKGFVPLRLSPSTISPN